MNVKLEDVINSVESLRWLGDVVLPAKSAFDLAHLLDAVTPILRQHDATRNKSLERLGEKVDGGYQVPEENREEYVKEMAAMLETECELPDTVIPVAPLKDDLTAARIVQLRWLLAKPEDGDLVEGDE